MDLVGVSLSLRREVARLRWNGPTEFVYNPLQYAWKSHRVYLENYGGAPKEVVLLGMNPGPWGMAQSGVPFGEVSFVRDWMGIRAAIDRPKREHPRVRITGFDCKRSEVSGRRLWGWACEEFKTPEQFFARFFVANYCPLMFLDAQGRNLTPDKLPAAQRTPLFTACDRGLGRLIACLRPKFVVGIGAFAESRARAVITDPRITVGRILHPSPASPAANRNWEAQAVAQMQELGIRSA